MTNHHALVVITMVITLFVSSFITPSAASLCTSNTDCFTPPYVICNVYGRCVPTSCTNGVIDGLETDTDCGGTDCSPCGPQRACSSGTDCFSGTCTSNICVGKAPGASCFYAGECAGNSCNTGVCGGLPVGSTCASTSDCVTGLVCASSSNQCRIPTGDTGHLCTTNTQCEEDWCQTSTSTCVSSHCQTLIMDDDETDIDCGGGTCNACMNGQGCVAFIDCLSSVCGSNSRCGYTYSETGCTYDDACQSGWCDTFTRKCVATSCQTEIRDGLETDVDCGGTNCTACANGQGCLVNTDCSSGVCGPSSLCGMPLGGTCTANIQCRSGWCNTATQQCVSSHCSTAAKDSDETDIDCGGGTCSTCVNNQTCSIGTDCSSSICDSNSRCGRTTGGTCTANNQCQSGVCNTISNLCVSSTCFDGILTPSSDETDIDCGGSCTPCTTGQGCSTGADCTSTWCDTISTHKCVATSCSTRIKDGLESDIDCGGSVCAKCLTGSACAVGSDCESGSCESNLCQDLPEAITISTTSIATTINYNSTIFNITCSNGTGVHALSTDVSASAVIINKRSDIMNGLYQVSLVGGSTTGTSTAKFTCTDEINLWQASADVSFTVNALPTITGGMNDIIIVVNQSPPVRTYTCSSGTAPYTLSATVTSGTLNGGVITIDSTATPVFGVHLPTPTTTLASVSLSITCMDSVGATSSLITYHYTVHGSPMITVPSSLSSVYGTTSASYAPPVFYVVCFSVVYPATNATAELSVTSSNGAAYLPTIESYDAINYQYVVSLPNVATAGTSTITFTCNDTTITDPSSSQGVTKTLTYTVVPPIEAAWSATLSVKDRSGYLNNSATQAIGNIICSGGGGTVTSYNLVLAAGVTSSYLVATRVSTNQFAVSFQANLPAILAATTASLTCVDSATGSSIPSSDAVTAMIQVYAAIGYTSTRPSPLVMAVDTSATMTVTCTGGLSPYTTITVTVSSSVPSNAYDDSYLDVVTDLVAGTATVTFGSVAIDITASIAITCEDTYSVGNTFAYQLVVQPLVTVTLGSTVTVAAVNQLGNSNGVNQTVTCGGGSEGGYDVTVSSSPSSSFIVRQLSATTWDIYSPVITEAGSIAVTVICTDTAATTSVPASTVYQHQVWTTLLSATYSLLTDSDNGHARTFTATCGAIGTATTTSGITYTAVAVSSDSAQLPNGQLTVTGTSPSFTVSLPPYLSYYGIGIPVTITCTDTTNTNGGVISTIHTAYRYLTESVDSATSIGRTMGSTAGELAVRCIGVNDNQTLTVTSSLSSLVPVVVRTSSYEFTVRFPAISTIDTAMVNLTCQATLAGFPSQSWFTASKSITYTSYAQISVDVEPVTNVVVSIDYQPSTTINITCWGGSLPLTRVVTVPTNATLQSLLVTNNDGARSILVTLPSRSVSMSATPIAVTCSDTTGGSLTSGSALMYTINDAEIIALAANDNGGQGIVNASIGAADVTTQVTCGGGGGSHYLSLAFSDPTWISVGITVSPVGASTTGVFTISFPAIATVSSVTITAVCNDATVTEASDTSMATASFLYRVIDTPIIAAIDNVYVSATYTPSQSSVTCSGGVKPYIFSMISSSNTALVQPSSITIDTSNAATGIYTYQLPSSSTGGSALITFECVDQRGAIAHRSYNYTVYAPVTISSSFAALYTNVGNTSASQSITCGGGSGVFNVTITVDGSSTSAYDYIDVTRVSSGAQFSVAIRALSATVDETALSAICVDAGQQPSTPSSVHSFTITVHPRLTIILSTSELTTLLDITPDTVTVTCGGGYTPYTRSTSIVSTTSATFTSASFSLSSGGVLSITSSSVALTAILQLSCQDSQGYSANSVLVYNVRSPVIAATISNVTDVTVTQTITPAAFNVTCTGDSLTSSYSGTTVTLLDPSANVYRVSLPVVIESSGASIVTLNCSNSMSFAVTSFTYTVNSRPTVTLSRSSVVSVYGGASSTIDVTCSGGTGALTSTVSIDTADDSSLITSTDVANFTYSASSSSGRLLLPSRSIDSSATIVVKCIDSFGVPSTASSSSIVWCIGSAVDRCAASCAWGTWSSCTSVCGGGIQFRTCATPDANIGTSSRSCNTAACTVTTDPATSITIGLTLPIEQASATSFKQLLIEKLAAVGGVTTSRITIDTIVSRRSTVTTSSVSLVQFHAMMTNLVAVSAVNSNGTLASITIKGRTSTSEVTSSAAASKIALAIFTGFGGDTDAVTEAIDTSYIPTPVSQPYVAVYPDCPGFIVCSSGGSAIIVLIAIFAPFIIACVCGFVCVTNKSSDRDPLLVAKLKEIGVIDSAPMTPIPGSVPSPYQSTQSLVNRQPAQPLQQTELVTRGHITEFTSVEPVPDSSLSGSYHSGTELTSIAPVATLQVV